MSRFSYCLWLSKSLSSFVKLFILCFVVDETEILSRTFLEVVSQPKMTWCFLPLIFYVVNSEDHDTNGVRLHPGSYRNETTWVINWSGDNLLQALLVARIIRAFYSLWWTVLSIQSIIVAIISCDTFCLLKMCHFFRETTVNSFEWPSLDTACFFVCFFLRYPSQLDR